MIQSISAQDIMNRDSLIELIPSMPRDTNLVLLYVNIGQQYENNLPDSAIHYYLMARDLSEELGYETGILKYISNITYVYNAQGKYDTALNLNLRAVDIAREHGSSLQLAACLGNVANSYLLLERYERAVEYFLQASDLIDRTDNTQYRIILYNNLAVTYLKLDQPAKGREYAEKAVRIAREPEDPVNLGISLDNLALTYIGTFEPEKSLPLLEEALSLANKTNNLYLKESILINFADAYLQMGQFERIPKYAKEGLQLAGLLGDKAGESTASLALGYYYLYLNQPEKARDYAVMSENSASDANLTEQLRKAYSLLGYISLSIKEYQKFREYLMKGDSINALMVNQNVLRNIQELETSYETERKEQLIRQLEKDKEIQKLSLRQNHFILVTLLGITFTTLMVSFLLIRGNRQKKQFYEKEKELQQTRINELEAEKQLLATEAVLKGQEDERTRLARDLHDSLGGMLSGIKLSFTHIKENLAKSQEDQEMFERGLDMLDGSIGELRTIAHNLMPETLLKFGLDTSLNDFCDSINNTEAINVSYQSIGLEDLKNRQPDVIIIYRIVQELINNALKHANATHIYVQVVIQEKIMTITVEDDGSGFDVRLLDESSGIGWNNIRSRVKYLNGRIDLQSETGHGTNINIYIPA